MYIKTERLTIKPISEEDSDSLAALLTNDQIKKTYMIPDFENEQQCRKMTERLRELSHDDSRCVAGIYLKEELIGFLNDVEIDNGSIELGYVIDPKHHNRGYATEALRETAGYLLEKGFREVITGAFEENAASIRVMVKAGMTRLEKEEKLEYRGEVHRCVYYAYSGKNEST